MNTDPQKTLAESSRRSPFWVCLFVFLLLACDYGYHLANLCNEREQLNQAVLIQAQNAGALAQARQLEARLESFSVELLQVAQTNAAAKQIVQDFNIQWNPGPAASNPASAASVHAPAASNSAASVVAPAAGTRPK